VSERRAASGPRGDGDAAGRGGPAVVLEERGPVALVRFNRPAERNPLSSPTLDELESTLDALAARPDLRAIILTGAGGAFASGANIRELAALSAAEAHAFARRGQRVMGKVAHAPQLTLAAVDGYCMGGGLDLALACDLRAASPASVFAHPGARLGVITGWGGTQRLARLVGEARAFELFLTARRLTADEALSWGLVNRVARDPLSAALDLAAAFGKKGDGI
jgi:enoyl-CoA hydratase/carnithine racemase